MIHCDKKKDIYPRKKTINLKNDINFYINLQPIYV